jgi:hypothetical protein
MLGAVAMVDDGLYKIVPKPDTIMSAHTMAIVPAGSIALREGRRMAGSDQLDAIIRGVGGHGSTPVPGEFAIQAAIGNSKSPRQCFSYRYLLVSTTCLPEVSIGVTPFRPE